MQIAQMRAGAYVIGRDEMSTRNLEFLFKAASVVVITTDRETPRRPA